MNFTDGLEPSLGETLSNLSEDTHYGSCFDAYDPDSDLNLFEFITNGVVLNVVGLLGVVGNVLSMVVLSRPQMKSSVNCLLIGLARCDTILILTSMMLFGLPAIYSYTGKLFYYYYSIYPRISPYVYPVAMIAQTASVYITMTVTLERWVAVCHPLRARALCTHGRARWHLCAIALFCILYNIPRFWEVSSREYRIRDTTIHCVEASDLRAESLYITLYIHWSYLVFLYFIPFSSLACLNAMIYRQIRKANRERQRLSRSQRREIGLATMLLCVVVVFFICNVLALVTNILEAFYHIIEDRLVKTSNMLVTINSSVNFIIYVIFGEKFKRTFLRLFCSPALSRSKSRRESMDYYSPGAFRGDESFISNGQDSRSIRLVRCDTATTTANNNGAIRGKRPPSYYIKKEDSVC
ncbi:FMRFamide receptor-like [Ctenocephalides felis]|uniref:FMRFamide receptor-like n=1 Tax=Ctenocephalides felis TaxID=7515 RepID=UPI000E6E1CD9|nr:FMRFamide receptor-like [Ctenocephalides felis]